METRSRLDCPGTAGLGPYKATKLWNDVISAFRQGVPRGKHRRYMRSADNCFLGSTAVDWLLEYLRKQKDFGTDVTRQQTTQLLNKFYKAGIFEEIQVSRRSSNKADFSDSNRLYRLLPVSPSKGTRTPLAVRTTSNIPQSVQRKDGKEEKPVKRDILRKERTSVTKSKESGSKFEAASDLNISSLPQCHLVGRFLTGAEINEIWKTAVLSRLKKVLGIGNLEDVLQDYPVDGGRVRHNCIFLNKSGIVTNIQPQDQLPHWVLSAMKCLARWPEKVEGDLPSYPGFEKDVFGVVKDYFMGLSEPLITYDLYDVIINTFVQACNQLPRHSSPFSHTAGHRPHFSHSLWSDSSLENVIMNLTRKYCMTDSKMDLFSLADSRPDLFGTSDGFSACYSHSNLYSTAFSHSHLANSQGDLAKSQRNLADSDRGKHRMAQSQGDLQHVPKCHTNTLPSAHSKSHSGLPGRRVANSFGDLHAMGECSRSLHGGCSATNLHASSSSHCLTSSSMAKSQSALRPLSGLCDFKDSKQFCSSPDLQVSRYETAFGPENQTVTRVYYCNGMATDFHHNSTQEQENLSPVETHFDVITDMSGSHQQSSHISFPHSNKSSNFTGCSESSQSQVACSCSFNTFQKQTSGVYDSSQSLRHSQPPQTASDHEPPEKTPSSPVCLKERKPPPYRRRRAERCNTFAGSQFTMETEKRGLDEWDREMSASTPYLPGLKLTTDSHTAVSVGARHGHSARSAAGSASRVGKRGSSLYLNLPQSGLHVERASKALQVVCLFLPPASRRKLHFLLKLMSKMAANPFLTFDPSQSTRSLVLGTFQHAVLRSQDDTDLDAVLVFQLVSFLVDHHMDIMTVPMDMKEAVEDRLRSLEKPQIVYSPRDPRTLRFSQPISVEQYEASKMNHSHNALVELLESIVRDQNMAAQEKRRRLMQFQKTYPQIYKRRFPDESSDPLQTQRRLKTKPPVFARPLLKLRGLRV